MITTKLKDVQKAALNARIVDGEIAQGFAFFMEQGLGKTLTSIADFADLIAERKATRMVVLCPNSFKGGWVSEIEEHGFDADIYVWEAGTDTYFKSWCKKKFTKPPVLIVNWEAIRAKKIARGKSYRWQEGRVTALIKEHFMDPVKGRVLVVYDESIQASTHNAAQTKGGMFLTQGAQYARILSGKPQKKGPHDLWSQYRLIGHLQDMEYHPFKTAFCKMGGFKGKEVMGVQNEQILQNLISKWTFRATKADWTDLPPKLPGSLREYKLTPEMEAMYKSMENDFVLWLNSEEVVTIDAALTKYIKLAQIQCGWIYDEDGKARKLVEDDKNPRLNLLKQILEDEIEGKVLIPYNFKPVFDQLLNALGGEDKVAWIKGQMSTAETEEQKRRFNTDPKVRYMLLQTRASKYGHTLLGIQDQYEHACRTMVFYENTYSLDDRSQIEDRPHRHGQNYAVSYIDLVGTKLDRDCVKALHRKEEVFQSVFAAMRAKKR